MANYFEDNPFFQSPFFKGDFFTGNAFFQSPFFGGAFTPSNPTGSGTKPATGTNPADVPDMNVGEKKKRAKKSTK